MQLSLACLCHILVKPYTTITRNYYAIKIYCSVYYSYRKFISAYNILWCYSCAITQCKLSIIMRFRSINSKISYLLYTVSFFQFKCVIENPTKIAQRGNTSVEGTAYLAQYWGIFCMINGMARKLTCSLQSTTGRRFMYVSRVHFS